MSDPFTAAEQAIARFVEVSRQAHEEVVAAIDAIPDPQDGLDYADRYFKEKEAEYEKAAKFRTQVVGRVWEAKELSLTALAEQMGVSRQRIGQIIAADKKRKAAEEEAPA